ASTLQRFNALTVQRFNALTVQRFNGSTVQRFNELIARQTVSAVSGKSRWRIPSGDSASMTAFAIAGVAPIVPASPTPLIPMGLLGEGVTVLPMRYSGMSLARGMG